MATRRCPFAASNDAFRRSPIGNDPLKASSLATLATICITAVSFGLDGHDPCRRRIRPQRVAPHGQQ